MAHNTYELGIVVIEKNAASLNAAQHKIDAAKKLFVEQLKRHEKKDRTLMLANLLALSAVECCIC